jgi:hypothetical protein
MVESLSGFRILAGYHDLTLTALTYDRTKLLLELKLVSETSAKVIELTACKYFRVNDFIPDSIVSRILVFSGDNSDRGWVEERVKWATSQSDASSYLNSEALNRVVEELQGGKLLMLVVEPSWGSELVAVCEKAIEHEE